MTLAELIQKADSLQAKLTSASIPLKLDGKEVEIDFELLCDDYADYSVKMTIR